jgi:hypothetical protein
VHVNEGRGSALIDPEGALAALGLRPSDLLSGVKTFLLVEGEHDKIVLEGLIGNELLRARCKLLVARGAKNMSDIFTSQFIFKYTDARLVALMDNIDAEMLTTAWAVARKFASQGQLVEAHKTLKDALPGKKSSENVFMREFLAEALTKGDHERVSVWGLIEEDIIRYLPPEPFGIGSSWTEAQKTRTAEDTNVKEWIKKLTSKEVSVEMVQTSVNLMTSVPNDFQALLKFLEADDTT